MSSRISRSAYVESLRLRGFPVLTIAQQVQNDDISHLLTNRKGSAGVDPALFATELEKFRAHQTRITATLHHQATTLSEIGADYQVLSEGKKAREIQGRWSEAEHKKKELIERLGRAKETYVQVRVGLQKGVQFYQDLCELVGGLRDQVSSFLATRNSERDQMASTAELRQRLEGPSRSKAPSSLDQRMGSLDLGPKSPPLPPQPPSWAAPPSPYSPPPQSAYSPPPSASPYQSLPTSGPFATSSSAPPPPANAYSAPPRQPSYPSPDRKSVV